MSRKYKYTIGVTLDTNSKFFGQVGEEVFIVKVDGAWKVNGKGQFDVGVGWVGAIGGQDQFQGNDKVFATTALQFQGFAFLKGNRGNHGKRLQAYVKIITNSRLLFQGIKKNRTNLDISSITTYISSLNFLFYELCKVDRDLVQGAHNLAVKARGELCQVCFQLCVCVQLLKKN